MIVDSSSGEHGKTERRILIGMITNSTFLGRIESKWHSDNVSNKWAANIGWWCVKHYRKYGKAPKKHIENTFEVWAAKEKNQTVVDMINQFLASISEEYEKGPRMNAAVLTDTASNYFNEMRLRKMANNVLGHLSNGDIEKAVETHATHDKIELGTGELIDVYQDEEAVKRWLEAQKEPYFRWPGALGQFFQNAFKPDTFISFLAGEKVGKSWWLQETAYQANKQRKKVVFFSVGDMSEEQIGIRIATRAANCPAEASDDKWPCEIRYPVKITPPGNEEAYPIVEWQTKEYKEQLSENKIRAAFNRMVNDRIKSKVPHLLLSVHPNDTLTVMGIKSILDARKRLDGWTPDLIIIDYADILAAPFGKKDEQDQINTTWKQLRALSQQYHCCVVTATQADARAYDLSEKKEAAQSDKPKKPPVLSRKNFSRDKRKLAHVTGMIGINVDLIEKDMEVRRLNWIVAREMAFSFVRVCYCAGCLALANPAVLSVMGIGTDGKKS